MSDELRDLVADIVYSDTMSRDDQEEAILHLVKAFEDAARFEGRIEAAFKLDEILDKLLAQTKGGLYSSVSGTVKNAVLDIRAEMRGEGRL